MMAVRRVLDDLSRHLVNGILGELVAQGRLDLELLLELEEELLGVGPCLY